MMIQIVSGLFAKQYFDDSRVAIKQQDRSFFRTEKKKSNHSKHLKGFSITRGSYIFRIRSDSYILTERFCQHQPGKHFGR